MNSRHRRALAIGLAVCGCFAERSFAQTYYVSPDGNDDNSGTSPGEAWASLNKVDSTDFTPGSSILFQDGGNWYGNLTATSSGTPGDPITYGSYGSGANPIFWGSDPVSAASFQAVGGEPDTYTYSTATTVNSFLVNHQFLNSASLVSGQSTDSGNVGYVEANPQTWYYDSTSQQLYVNTGSAITPSDGNVYTAAVRQNVVFSNQQSNLVFNNLTVQESAAYNGGYAFYAENGSNVTFENDTAIAAGKHAFAAIDTTGFLGQNLSASNLMPNQGFGGATAYVSYADYNVTGATQAWNNISFTNPNGPYPAFITHTVTSPSNSTPLASVSVQNLYASYSAATVGTPAIVIYTNPGNEQVNVNGAVIIDGSVSIAANNVTLDRLQLTGAGSEVDLDGDNNTLQNSIIAGGTPNWEAGHLGTITVNGQSDIIRYNTVISAPTSPTLGAAIGLENAGSETQIYGNIIDSPYAAYLQTFTGDPGITAFNNLYAGTANPQVIYYYSVASDSPISDWSSADNANAIYGDPLFADAADGNYSLLPGSPAIAAFDPTTDEWVAYDVYGDARPLGLVDLGAIEVPEPAASSWALVLAAPILLARGRRRPIS